MLALAGGFSSRQPEETDEDVHQMEHDSV